MVTEFRVLFLLPGFTLRGQTKNDESKGNLFTVVIPGPLPSTTPITLKTRVPTGVGERVVRKGVIYGHKI